MPTIDDKVVAMSFESSKFEQGVAKTISSLDKLKAALTFKGTTGFDNLAHAAKGVELGHLSHGIENIGHKLGFLRLTAISVFADIATAGLEAGRNLVKSLTLDPILVGYNEYALKLQSIQTILANTEAAGTGLKEVNDTLQELNLYSDKTIYNFGQMAKNIGTFTAAGVELDEATSAIKGIANLAALSGSTSEQASTAMYQLSQAIAAGRVSLMDWNSVVNAGMGGTVFQRALAQTAVAMGTLKDNSLKLVGPMKNVSINGESFRNSLASVGPGGQSWLTSKVLTTTLAQFTGDLKDAELAAMGFNKQQIKAIQQTAKTAMHAATEVKNIKQLFDVAREAAGSGWAQTWELIFGDFEEAKKTFTNASNALNGFINASAKARNKVLGDWKQLGGRTALIAGIKNIFEALGAVLGVVKDAFHDIFPPTTGQDLFRLTQQFLKFTESLKPSPETLELLKRTFRGLFAILDIGKQIIGGIIGVFGDVFDKIGEGSGGFLEFTASVGDWLVKLDEALKKGDGLKNFFDILSKIILTPIELLSRLKDAIGEVFGGFSAGGISGEMSAMSSIMEVVVGLWEEFLDLIGSAAEIIEPVVEAYVTAMARVGDAIILALENMDFDAVLQLIRTGLIGGIFLMFKKFLGKGAFTDQLAKGFAGIGGGILKNISGSFAALQGSLVGLQQNIKAKTLKEIAIAVGILAISMVALSFVDPKKLQSSLTAITVAFGELLGAMAVLTLVTKTTGFIKLPFIASSLILLAGAILVLTASVVVLSMLSWESLLKGLLGVGVLLGIIAVAAIPLSANSAGMVRAGVGITAIAVGLLILSQAVTEMSELSWGEMAKGLIGIGIGLGIIVAITNTMPAGGMIGIGLGLILVSAALKVLASAVQDFADLSWGDMAKGMLGIAGALLIIAGTMKLMPGPSMLLTGAGLLVVAIALGQIADVIADFGGMSMSEIAKGLGALAGSLIILGVALYAMSGTIGGAIALTIAAAGITLMAAALEKMGNLSWGEIIQGMIVLAATIGILAGISALAAGAVLPMLGLGAALLLIGGGLALIGLGLTLIGAGLSALIVAIPTGLGIMLAAITEFRDGLIRAAKDLLLGLLEVVKAFAEIAPEFVDALVDILGSLVDVVIEMTPKIVEMFGVILDAIIDLLDQHQDDIIQAAFDLLIALLQGIRNNIGQITILVIEIITALVTALAEKVDMLLGAGLNLLLAIIQGIANNISRLATAGANIVVMFINGLGNNYAKIVTAGTNFIIKLISGIGANAGRLVTAGVDAVLKFIQGLGQNAVRLARGAAQVILDFLRGLRQAVEDYSPQITEEAIGIGWALIEGVVEGVMNKAGDVYSALEDIAREALSKLKKPWELLSPSHVTREMGQNLILGLVLGIQDSSDQFVGAIEDTGNKAVNTMQQTLRNVSGMVADELDTSPTITPVLDLTEVRGQAQELSKLTDISPIASTRAASAISAAQRASEAEQIAASGGAIVQFEQNNYSPRALSDVDIYRQTRNSLSQIKSALAIT